MKNLLICACATALLNAKTQQRCSPEPAQGFNTAFVRKADMVGTGAYRRVRRSTRNRELFATFDAT